MTVAPDASASARARAHAWKASAACRDRPRLWMREARAKASEAASAGTQIWQRRGASSDWFSPAMRAAGRQGSGRASVSRETGVRVRDGGLVRRRQTALICLAILATCSMVSRRPEVRALCGEPRGGDECVAHPSRRRLRTSFRMTPAARRNLFTRETAYADFTAVFRRASLEDKPPKMRARPDQGRRSTTSLPPTVRGRAASRF